MNRREMILRAALATLGLGLSGCAWRGTDARAGTKRVLCFSKCSGFEHSVVKRIGGEPSYFEKVLAPLGPERGIEFSFSKDGSLFTTDYLAGFDAYLFYTSGDLTTAGADGNPPMTAEGKAALLKSIENGKGFVGVHSATDTFRTRATSAVGNQQPTSRYVNDNNPDPYIQMIGAEFVGHGPQQKARIRVVDSSFPGARGAGGGFEWLEEWYSFKNFRNDLHVLLVQETQGLTSVFYQRPPYPDTWARMHGKGRVFYTGLGHREDVLTNPLFHEVLFGGIAWAVRNVNAEVGPNIDRVAPGYAQLPSAANQR